MQQQRCHQAKLQFNKRNSLQSGPNSDLLYTFPPLYARTTCSKSLRQNGPNSDLTCKFPPLYARTTCSESLRRPCPRSPLQSTTLPLPPPPPLPLPQNQTHAFQLRGGRSSDFAASKLTVYVLGHEKVKSGMKRCLYIHVCT